MKKKGRKGDDEVLSAQPSQKYIRGKTPYRNCKPPELNTVIAKKENSRGFPSNINDFAAKKVSRVFEFSLIIHSS